VNADVVIIGAGPAGTAAAAHLGQLGVRDVVLVDKLDFPRDKTCGSGLSPKGIATLRELGVWAAVEPHAYRITGIRLVTPGGHESYQSAGDAVEAVICQRRVLDELILRRAESLGVRFVPHFVADRLLEKNGRVTGVVAKDGRAVNARITVVAGGTHCRLGPGRERHSLLPDEPRLIKAIMGWWEGAPFRKGHVEMLFDPDLAPYYGWLFPENEEKVNIGITYEDAKNTRNAREVFQRFLDKHYAARLRSAKQIGAWKGHPIAYSYRVRKLTSKGCMLIGEAGLLTHPATGEGIYQGMKSGVLAAEALRSLLAGEDEAAAFARYEKRVRAAFQLSFLGGAVFRALVKTPILDWAVKASEQPMVQSAAAKLIAAM
jgi:geranylgeranyl reductase family protein